MKDGLPNTFLARVRRLLPDLHPTERRLAEAVLDFPGDMAGYTATEIADLAGVSNASVSRFVRKLGYSSYDEARKAVREEGQTGAALLRFGTQQTQQPSAVAAHLEQSRLNLEATYNGLSTETVDELAQAICAARHVWIAGFRAAHPLASYFGWQISQVVPNLSVLPKQGETLAETMATIGPGDVMVILLLRRAPKLAWSLIEEAQRSGSKLALISDVQTSRFAAAHWVFPCSTASPGPLLNHVGAMAVCNLLAARTLENSGRDGRARMSRIEDLHERFAEL